MTRDWSLPDLHAAYGKVAAAMAQSRAALPALSIGTRHVVEAGFDDWTATAAALRAIICEFSGYALAEGWMSLIGPETRIVMLRSGDAMPDLGNARISEGEWWDAERQLSLRLSRKARGWSLVETCAAASRSRLVAYDRATTEGDQERILETVTFLGADGMPDTRYEVHWGRHPVLGLCRLAYAFTGFVAGGDEA